VAAAVIETGPDGVFIDVRVIPRASRSAIAGARDGSLLVRLTAPPVEGAANAELVCLIAEVLEVPKRAVAVVSGERSRQKRIKVTGLTEREVAQRLQAS
jgi:uncharacterized protein (TIGR00251 family)